MPSYFKNKYRIESNRKSWWDYNSDGMYFLTICTKNRIDYFGKIKDEKMILTDIGNMAYECWRNISAHFPHAFPMDFIVMPDHVHGILKIDAIPMENTQISEVQNFAPLIDDQNSESKSTIKPKKNQNRFGPQSKNLASVIRGFKIGVTKFARTINPDFAWQSNYFDSIILNEKSLNIIQKYIANNPKNYKK